MAFKKLLSRDALCILLIVAVILFFFRDPLFSSQVFVAGDIGLSDFTDFFLSSRLFLSRVLKSGRLPLWSKSVGFGFPLLAEGQIQALFPPNLIFLVFSPVFAYNFSIFLAVAAIGLSTYFFCRRGLKLDPFVALFAALAFALSAPVTMHWKHVTMLWVLAAFPLELYVVERLFSSVIPSGPRSAGGVEGSSSAVPKKRLGASLIKDAPLDFSTQSDKSDLARNDKRKVPLFILEMALLVAFQALAGHPQMTAYAMVIVGLFFGYKFFREIIFSPRLRDESTPLVTNRELNLAFKLLTAFLAFLALGLALAAVQLLPTWELLQNSWRAGGLSYEKTLMFPFYFKHLATLLVPFSFGDPSNWAPYLEYDPRILVWEICSYSGLLTAVFGSLAVSFLPLRGGESTFESKRLRKFAWFFSFLALFSVLQARFNFLYFLPLFSRFRVPARFVTFLSFSLCILAGLFLEDVVYNQVLRNWGDVVEGTNLEHLGKRFAKRLAGGLLLIIVVLLAADYYLYFGKYNQTIGEGDWLAKPGAARFLEDDLRRGRFISLGTPNLAGNIYAGQRGWRKEPRAYLDYHRALPPNQQLVWDLPGASAYAGVYVKRGANYREFIKSSFGIDVEEGKAYPPRGMANFLSFGGITHVAVPFSVESEEFAEVYREEFAHREGSLYVYEVKNSLPRAHFVSKARYAEDEGEALGLMLTGAVDPWEEVVLVGEKEHTSTKLSAGGSNRLETDDTDAGKDIRGSGDQEDAERGKTGTRVTGYPDIRGSGDGEGEEEERDLKVATVGEQSAKIVVDEDQRVVVEVSAPREGYLVLADTYYPGWVATIREYRSDRSDRTYPAEILRANYNFRAVRVPAGESVVEFRYEPASFRYGVIISFVGLGIWVGLAVYVCITNANKRK